jgi:hypothetical protein
MFILQDNEVQNKWLHNIEFKRKGILSYETIL